MDGYAWHGDDEELTKSTIRQSMRVPLR